jgi:hypothetical protein
VYWLQQNPDVSLAGAVMEVNGPAWGHFVQDLSTGGTNAATHYRAEVLDVKQEASAPDVISVLATTRYQDQPERLLAERLVFAKSSTGNWLVRDHVVRGA